MAKTMMIASLLIMGTLAAARPSPDSPPQYGHAPQPGYKDVKEPPKPYQFDYGVRDDYSGSAYGHQETSDGNTVQGSFQVALPDGRIQTTKYIADHENGYQAQVSYEGEAKYPEEQPKTQNAYQSASKPVYAPAAPQGSYSRQAPEPVYRETPEIVYGREPEQVPVYQSEPEQDLYEEQPIYTNK